MKKTTFRPTMENLESRELFAGNVAVNVNAYGDLRINGDNQPNGIEVTRLSQGTYKITGVTHGGATTLVNGLNSLVVENVTRDVEIQTRDGNDLVRIYNPNGVLDSLDPQSAVFPRNLQIEAGDGADLLVLKHAWVQGSTSIDMGDDSDRLITQATNFSGDVSIDMGSDNASDTIDIKTFWTLSDFELTTGGGNDFVTLYDLTAYGNADIRTGGDRDTVTLDHVEVRDHLFADLGSGDDTLHAKFVTASSSDVSGGYGNDQFYTYWWLGADSNEWGNGSPASFEYRYRRVLG